ncbi:MAG: hypothetical protein IIW54_03170 [Lachnospiraceae bacterium]|nr:hypothetical protein [Lachnospiraceae bacterium]
MNMNYIEWYEKCMDSLFAGRKDNWVYDVVRKLTNNAKNEKVILHYLL